MNFLNARTGLGPQVKLYRGDTLLASFVDVTVFCAIMGASSVVSFNAEHRTSLVAE